jgi:serine/threonine protein kinase
MLKTTNNFYFIYEYCNGGTLEGLLAKEKKLPEQKALLIFKQLLEAFQILNKYNIMHRDMKPDNIFFHNGVIKLGDFGFCKNLNSADEMTKTMLGSPIYMAPEVLKGEIYSNKADIWSLGVVLYEMLFGHCPFQSNSIANLIEVLNTQTLAFPSQISPYLKNVISRMLTKDSLQRIGWMELFQIKINNEGQIE